MTDPAYTVNRLNDGCPFCGGRIDASVTDDGKESRHYARHLPHCAHPEWLGKPADRWWRTDWKREGRPTYWNLEPAQVETMKAQLHGFLKRTENGQ